MKPTLRLSLTLGAIAISVSACGFHLRGSQGTGALTFTSLSIIDSGKTAVAQNLADIMRRQTTLVTAPTAGQVNAEIGEVRRGKAVLTKDVQGRAVEYRMTSNITMQAYDANKNQLIAPITLSTTRTLISGNGYDTGLELEEARLNRDMDFDLANQIQYRLRAIKLKP